MKPKVIVLGQDLVELGYAKNLIDLNERKTFRRAKLITNTYTFQVDNDDDYFSIDNPNSIFHGSNWRYSEIQVYNVDGIKIWEGIIIDIQRNHITKKAKILCKNTFFKYRKEIVDYQSSDWETGATAFKNICDAMGFEKYNQRAYTDSRAQLINAGCKLQCNFNAEDGVSFMDAINKLAEFSNADLYVHNDELYFQHWQPFTGGVTITIEGDKKGELRKAPIVDSPEKDIINDYEIDYFESGETPATDSNSNRIGSPSRKKFGPHMLSTLRSGTVGQIVFENKLSAVYIGESYIKETNRNYDTQPNPPQRNIFSIHSDYRKYITLGTYFRFNFAEEGWENRIFETFEFTIDEEKDEIKIVSYEV